MKIDKILKVSNNLVVIYFVDKPCMTIATDNGTAYKLAMELLVDDYKLGLL